MSVQVETIGDAYMVVSGLNKDKATNHVVEIANMALDLIRNIYMFKISHHPEYLLQLRIGFHAGPCAAGNVANITMRNNLYN